MIQLQQNSPTTRHSTSQCCKRQKHQLHRPEGSSTASTTTTTTTSTPTSSVISSTSRTSTTANRYRFDRPLPSPSPSPSPSYSPPHSYFLAPSPSGKRPSPHQQEQEHQEHQEREQKRLSLSAQYPQPLPLPPPHLHHSHPHHHLQYVNNYNSRSPSQLLLHKNQRDRPQRQLKRRKTQKKNTSLHFPPPCSSSTATRRRRFMPSSRDSAFTTAAMATALEETTVQYEDLTELERAFEDAETDILRYQVTKLSDLYTKRSKTIAQIPGFWPLVFEQAPPEIDDYIQLTDSALLLSSLTTLTVTHHELTPSSSSATPQGGDPRSVTLTFEFAQNDYFNDTILEKRFWYRRNAQGWTGLVSEPVRVNWKQDKDLTEGLLDLAHAAYHSVPEGSSKSKNDGKNGKREEVLTSEQEALKKKIESTGMGGVSFFAWFGYVGKRISAEESREAVKLDAEKRLKRDDGNDKMNGDAEEEDEDDDEDVGEDEEEKLEIFPDGDELAIAITEDLWPNAIHYFTQAQEQDALSDAGFESDDENEEMEHDAYDSPTDEPETGARARAGTGGRPAKKHRSS